MLLCQKWLLYFLAHCALSRSQTIQGDLWKAPSPLTDYWAIPVDGPGACGSEQVARLNIMSKDIQMIGAMLLHHASDDELWNRPPKWFLDLANSMFAVENWGDNSEVNRVKKRIMRGWALWIGNMWTRVPNDDDRILLFCDSDLMELEFPWDPPPLELEQPASVKTVRQYLEGLDNYAFESWWWLYIPRVGSKSFWARLPRVTKSYPFPPYTHQYPTVAFNEEGFGLPFQTSLDNPNFPTYCAGLRERGDTLALTLHLEELPDGQPKTVSQRPDGRMIILCPAFFKNPTDKLDYDEQANGTPLEDMKPAWHPWFHEMFHIKDDQVLRSQRVVNARDAQSVSLDEGQLRSSEIDLQRLQKSMFRKNHGRTWDAISCIGLALYERAEPKLESGWDSETIWNPETWTWFATAGALSEIGPWHQDWSTGKCTEAYPPEYIDHKPPKFDPDGGPPPYVEAPPVKRHAAHRHPSPSLPLTEPWQSSSFTESDTLNAMLETNLTKYHGIGT